MLKTIVNHSVSGYFMSRGIDAYRLFKRRDVVPMEPEVIDDINDRATFLFANLGYDGAKNATFRTASEIVSEWAEERIGDFISDIVHERRAFFDECHKPRISDTTLAECCVKKLLEEKIEHLKRVTS